MKILIIEDDRHLSTMLHDELVESGHTVEMSDDGKKGSFTARTNTYDAMILDYSLPSKNGIEVCAEIRKSGKTTPIIFLSATSDVTTKVQALDAGADDYMTKPFSLRELHSRLKALNRRPTSIQKDIINVGDVTVNCSAQIVSRGGKVITLARREYALMEFLARNAGKTMSRAEIMDRVWSAEVDPFSNTIEAHVRLLRKKLGKKDGKEIIQNVVGRGYVIMP